MTGNAASTAPYTKRTLWLSLTMANANIRAIVVGDGGVGKSCFIISWTAGVFPSGYVPTVFDNRVGDVVVDGESVGVLFWDTRKFLHGYSAWGPTCPVI